MTPVVIKNLSRDVLLAWKGRLADSFAGRLVGLLGRRHMEPGEALILRPCNSIHSFFMRFPFDAVFLDGKGRVIASVSRMSPFRILKPVYGGETVIELPAGTLEGSGTRVGDVLVWFSGERGETRWRGVANSGK